MGTTITPPPRRRRRRVACTLPPPSFCLIFLISVFHHYLSLVLALSTATEREILLQFFQETEGHQWFRSDSWGSPQVSICQWWGITCSGHGSDGEDEEEVTVLNEGGVTEVRLPKNNVARSIATLFQLPNLRLVDLKQNPIDRAGFDDSSQQQQQQQLLVLEALDLSDCLLTDIVPGISSWRGGGASETLRELYLARNQFRGKELPYQELVKLSHLEILDLSSNSIRGPLFPAAAAAAANSNETTATSSIWTSWSNTLLELHLQDNKLSGSIPDAIADLQQLRILNLARNRLTGTLPAEALNSLAFLTEVNLQAQEENKGGGGSYVGDDTYGLNNGGIGGLWGDLAAFTMASRLTTLVLSHNQFSGSIPDNLMAAYYPQPPSSPAPNDSNSNVGSSSSSSSIFGEGTSSSDPSSFNFPELVTVDVSFNLLSGTVPESLVNRFGAANLDLHLVGNSFLVGPLPESFCNQTQWMQGQVGNLGCDAIACPPGYYNRHYGKATSTTSSATESCHVCPTTTTNTTTLGATKCSGKEEDDDPAPSESVILAELYRATSGPDSWTKRQGWEELVTAVDALLLLQEQPGGGGEHESIWNTNTTTTTTTITDSSSSSSVVVTPAMLCALQGIICNGQGKVTMITLSNNGLVGTIPSSLFRLPHLASLDLSENYVQVDDGDQDQGGGGLASLKHAHSLTRLKLSYTRIRSLRHISLAASTLSELAMDGNNLNGPLPMELFKLTNLVDLHLTACFLTGTIPADISKLTKLKRLHLNENQLSGDLPVGLAQLSELEELDLSDNMLEGTLPTEWNKNDDDNGMSRLLTLRINNNNNNNNNDNGNSNGRGSLGGPMIAFSGLRRIEVLELANNAFTGTIPADFLSGRSRDGSMRIDFSRNQLSGSLPSGLADLSRLFLALEDNNITGVPVELCQNNDWMDGEVGKVPDRCDAILCPPGTWSVLGRASVEKEAMCVSCESAAYFGATTCDVGEIKQNPEADILDQLYYSTGGPWWRKPHYNWTKPSIPICFREGVRCLGTDPNYGVVEVYLNEFGLRGKIPDEIFDLPEIRLLGFSFNHVDLSLKKIGNAAKLQSLLISATDVKSLEGIENAGDKFFELHVAKNGWKGSFPTELLYMSSLQGLYINENRFSGLIPAEIGLHMKGLRQLVLFGNRFVGYLPSELGLLPELAQLHVQGNLLSGLIPSSFSKLQMLEDLNLSGQKSIKKFTGPLFSFKSNAALRRIDLSGNTFAGTIPQTFLNSVDPGASIYANLSINELHGAVPASLAAFQNLEIDLASNMISFIPEALCNNTDWMAGMVGIVHPDEACNAILCPPGTFSASGRQIHANAPCQECERKEDAPYYGSVHCKGTITSAPCTVEVVDGNAVCSDATTERSTLELLFASTWGGGWKNKTLWMTDKPICSWEGVICDGEKENDAGVVALELANNGLVGGLPSQIWSLPELKRVALHDNLDLSVSMRGMPERTPLQTLLLRGNQVGSLEGLSRAVSLRELSVSGLSGTFPEDLFKLRNLEKLNLDGSFFVGTLPVDFVFLQRLKIFSAKGNDFHGPLPVDLVRLPGLEELILDENLISGTLPDELSSASSLRVLSIARERKSGRKLSGPLASLSNAPFLESISLQGNEFSGSIPRSFATSSSHLQVIDLRDNLLTGPVPEELDGHPGLRLLLAGNRFSSLPQEFCVNEEWMNRSAGEINPCSSILCPPGAWSPSGRAMNSSMTCSECPTAEKTPFFGSTSCGSTIDERSALLELFEACDGYSWYRRDFWATPTPVCEWFGIGCLDGNVILINLQGNNLECQIPSSLFRIPQLKKLYLASNRVNVNFKYLANARQLSELRLSMTRVSSLAGIGSARSLSVLDLSSTNLTGTIPTAIFALNNMRVLSLRDNLLSGELPQSWGQLRYLRILRLDNNRFTGAVPSFADSEVLRYIFLGGNALNGTIPVDFLQRVSPDEPLTIDFAGNQLVGSIPQDLARFKLVKLLAAGNQIESLPSLLCANADWNDGDVGRYGCDAILCPPGTRSAIGRRDSNGVCSSCALSATSESYGQLSCLGEVASSSASRATNICLTAVALSWIFGVLRWL